MMKGKAIRYLIACSFALGTLAIAGVRPAWAGCPNACEIDVDPPIVEPAQGGCAIVEALKKSCDCGVRVNIGNSCPTDLVASGFTFLTCETDAGVVKDCTTVQRGQLGWIVSELNNLGPVEWNYNLQTERGEERVTIRANVKEFTDSSCVCSLPLAANGGESIGLLLMAHLLAGCVVFRRQTRPDKRIRPQ